MKILVVGGGGREHAFVWSFARSERVEKVYCAPGNAGTAEIAENLDIQVDDLDGLARFARRERIDLTVVGPEMPLVAGIVARFEREDLKIFGPSKQAAELEGSKVFCKNLMRRHGIPSAEYQVFEDLDKARAYIEGRGEKLVVKADGLAAGKGVIVCDTPEEALAAAERVLGGEFGAAGARLVVEERLRGEEASILALTDGTTIAPLASSQDHKAALDGDKGPNTGGMGAYSPAPVVTPEVMERVISDVLVPTVHAMKKEGRPYKGVLYAGVMVTEQGPKVLEFNVRMGDPETQPLLVRLKTDLATLLEAVVDGRLEEMELEWDERPAVCVVMASGGYPGNCEKGREISGLEAAGEVPDTVVFHAGTAEKDGKVVTAGGRVLGVTSLGDTIEKAIGRAYEAVGLIGWKEVHYRRDIGAKAIGR
ncbi:MAG: phosphoribosylamine--glycine ligase [Planctomycetota bacterium]|jgi:phosphoribosylamine--glycine ligase